MRQSEERIHPSFSTTSLANGIIAAGCGDETRKDVSVMIMALPLAIFSVTLMELGANTFWGRSFCNSVGPYLKEFRSCRDIGASDVTIVPSQSSRRLGRPDEGCVEDALPESSISAACSRSR
jgi:hypothetical protein